jgi:diguanylate cyclase (GGDEF)-like protein
MAVALERRAEQARESRERIEFLAHHDNVTGLPNELLLMERLEERIQAATMSGDSLAVLFIDLDRFRSVNESFDRAGGDSILFDMAKRLAALAGAGDIVARLSADEFVCVIGRRRHTELADLAMRMLYAAQEPFIVDGKPVNLGARIGIALFPADGGNAATLVKHADTAKRRAKTGRQKIEFFNHELDAAALRGWSLENELRVALDHGQLMLYYQPKVDLRTGKTVGAEALIRWQHPVRGLVPPVEFIPVAERSRLIIPIGDWVILEACRQGARWIAAGLPPLNIAVNVSAEQFLHGDVEGAVRTALQSTGFPAESFELEITEGVLLRDVDRDLDRLRNLNVKISVDDFGTGYSCLSYLKNLKVDKLKVDQSFVRHLTDNASDQAITSAILNMAKSLGLHVVAEGIETAEAEALLKEMGCDQGQGYLYARPLLAAEFEVFLREEIGQKR